MNKQKVIAIVVIVGLLLAVIGIAIYVLTISNVIPPTSTTDEEGQSTMHDPNTDKPGDSTPVAPDENSQPVPFTNTKLIEVLQSDPIYEYIGQGFRTSYYSISQSVDENLQLVIIILINMPTPKSPGAQSNAERHRQNALQQIRNWGFDPNNYTIEVMYRD